MAAPATLLSQQALQQDSIQVIFESLPLAVMLTNRDGIIQYVNPAFEGATGYSHDEAVGKTPRILKSGQHHAEFYENLWKQIMVGRSFQGTIINRKKTGQLYWAEQTITPLRDSDGDLSHFFSVLQDVTGLKRKQEHEVQLRLARELQQRFYGTPPVVAGFDFGASAYPAHETGGDYLDFIPLGNDRMAIAVGDVEGHGFGSALVMALTRAYLRSFATMDLEPDRILSRLNKMILRDLDSECFVTLALVQLDLRNRQLIYAGAGHEPGFVFRASGEIECMLESNGPPLGLFPDACYSCQSTISLDEGQVVALLTDGVTECRDDSGVEFGAQRAIQLIASLHKRPAAEIADCLYSATRSFSANCPQEDDLTSIIIKVGR